MSSLVLDAGSVRSTSGFGWLKCKIKPCLVSLIQNAFAGGVLVAGERVGRYRPIPSNKGLILSSCRMAKRVRL